MTGFLPILHSKPLKRVFPNLLGTLVGSVRLGNGANWITYSKLPTGDCGKKGTLCLTLNTSGMLCRRLKHFGTLCGCLGRVSVGTTVNKSDMLDKYQ